MYPKQTLFIAASRGRLFDKIGFCLHSVKVWNVLLNTGNTKISSASQQDFTNQLMSSTSIFYTQSMIL